MKRPKSHSDICFDRLLLLLGCKAPVGLEDGSGRALNKGKIYISKSSPECVLDAYSQQFNNDFSSFIACRSHEMVTGGRMVLSFMGRTTIDPTSDHSCYQWELLARSLMSMVSQGLLEEEKVDCFDAPYYAPCMEEVKKVIEKEGSFMVEEHDACEIEWDGGMELQSDSRGERVSRTLRAVLEPMLESHFGPHIMDELFRRFGQHVEEHLSNNDTKYINLVVSLVKL
ncbi:jasmonate O-methyltransferase-like [Vigna radiata var. radiata]|uniref:Jasmonate O-methyltransferase-like n=1 Tax=Vigna radiata var. radiata TaxID=3916 RepID=A0A1S3UBT9_VIGRR|nr:jasmonate O-methyltransferase-like [Vigna radiata var. radiata]